MWKRHEGKKAREIKICTRKPEQKNERKDGREYKMRKYWCKIPDHEVKENCFWKESKGSKDKRKTVEERKQERKKERATSTKRDMEVEGRERKERQQEKRKAITDRHKVKKDK